ncbi:hypothetical protein [Enterocloster citroniae]|uniref:hypothetical protein n=1 Tax=Enterocloster citroniae TaxID=358743 RepID=UPI002E7A0CEE|nr:hypothetical protein [Enterocloster citroniae]
MPRYRYKAKNLDGKVFKGVMEAADEDALLKGLRFKGLYCMDYHSMESGTKLRPVKLKGKMLPPLCRQLAAMLAAGVPLSRALAVSYESSQDRCNFSYRIQIKATSNPYNSLNPLTWSESP